LCQVAQNVVDFNRQPGLDVGPMAMFKRLGNLSGKTGKGAGDRGGNGSDSRSDLVLRD